MSVSSRVCILHVDDDAAFGDVVADFLEAERDAFEVLTETDPEAVLATIAEQSVDCVVSDYDMPRMDGLELLEAVRAEYPDLPFILFTGKGTETVASRAISAGVTDYLQKETASDQFALLANRIENAVEQRERRRQFETLVENVPGLVYRSRNEPGWPVEFIAGDVEALTGYTAEAFESGEVSIGEELVHPDDRERVRREIQRQLDADGTFELTWRIFTKEGEKRWGWGRGQAVATPDDGPAILEGFVTDITDRKEREREIQRQRTLFSTLVENLPVGVLVEDGSRQIRAVNSTLFEVLGVDATSPDVVGSDCIEAARSVEHLFADPDEVVETIRHLLDSRERVTDRELTLADGRIIEYDFIPYELPDGTANLWVYYDDTERRRRERQLESYSETLKGLQAMTQTLLTASDIDEAARIALAGIEDVIEFEIAGLWLFDEDSRALVPAAISESHAKHIDEVPTYTPADESLSWEAFETGTLRVIDDTHEYEQRYNPGTEIRSEIIAPLDDFGVVNVGTVEPSAFTETDVTCVELWTDTVTMVFRRLQQEQQLRERETELVRERDRLEEFASVISHDLQNPLNVASGRLDMVAEECNSDHIDTVQRSLDRMERLVEDVLVLARQGETVGETERVPLSGLVQQCWKQVHTASATLECETDRVVRADRGRLTQVFENLFCNAIEHGGPTVTVTVGDCPGGFYVADDGRGIPEAAADSLFESGYSTSEEGTGFGLAIAKRIVEAHGWEIRVTDSEPGGARFEILGVE